MCIDYVDYIIVAFWGIMRANLSHSHILMLPCVKTFTYHAQVNINECKQLLNLTQEIKFGQ